MAKPFLDLKGLSQTIIANFTVQKRDGQKNKKHQTLFVSPGGVPAPPYSHR